MREVPSKITAYYCKQDKDRLCQGDILRNVSFFVTDEDVASSDKSKIVMKYAVVLTQDCDLRSDALARTQGNDYHDKYLPAILVCPCYQYEEFIKGEHIEGWKMQGTKEKINRDKLVENNSLNRYHYLNTSPDLFIPELVVDFKHFFTIPTETLYNILQKSYIATASELFRERLSQRFTNYLSRIGLPEIYCTTLD